MRAQTTSTVPNQDKPKFAVTLATRAQATSTVHQTKLNLQVMWNGLRQQHYWPLSTVEGSGNLHSTPNQVKPTCAVAGYVNKTVQYIEDPKIVDSNINLVIAKYSFSSTNILVIITKHFRAFLLKEQHEVHKERVGNIRRCDVTLKC
jgi:hypothetical protein